MGVVLSWGCDNNNFHLPEDRILATAGNRMLYQSEISGIFPEGASKEDSTSITNQYVENWIRKSIVLNEAEKNLKSQLDIDKLVSDYRESLLIYNYEKKLVEEQLDTMITVEQKEDFYLQNKDTYKLVNPIVRAISIEVPSDLNGLGAFKRNWIRQNSEEIAKFVENNKLSARLDEANWVNFAKFKEMIPEDLFSDMQLKSKKSLDKEFEGTHYFVRVLDFLDTYDTAPLSYIDDKVEKVILYNRKVDLLRTIKEKLYQNELKLNRVKIYAH